MNLYFFIALSYIKRERERRLSFNQRLCFWPRECKARPRLKMWTSRFKGQILEKAEWQTTCVAKEQKSHLFNVLGSPTSCRHPLFSCHGRRLQVNIVLS